jgi:Icc-related predicted phosphoesterase
VIGNGNMNNRAKYNVCAISDIHFLDIFCGKFSSYVDPNIDLVLIAGDIADSYVSSHDKFFIDTKICMNQVYLDDSLSIEECAIKIEQLKAKFDKYSINHSADHVAKFLYDQIFKMFPNAQFVCAIRGNHDRYSWKDVKCQSKNYAKTADKVKLLEGTGFITLPMTKLNKGDNLSIFYSEIVSTDKIFLNVQQNEKVKNRMTTDDNFLKALQKTCRKNKGIMPDIVLTHMPPYNIISSKVYTPLGDFSTDIGSKALRYAIDFEFNETPVFVFGHCHKGFSSYRAYEEKNANSGIMQSFYNVSIVSDDMALTFNHQKFAEFITFTIGNY